MQKRVKANSYFARARILMNDYYGIFQIKLILISPANVCRVRVPQSELCIIAELVYYHSRIVYYQNCVLSELCINCL